MSLNFCYNFVLKYLFFASIISVRSTPPLNQVFLTIFCLQTEGYGCVKIIIDQDPGGLRSTGNAWTKYLLRHQTLNVSFSSKCTSKGTWRQVFICLRPHPLLGFCLCWLSNFLDSESGQMHIV